MSRPERVDDATVNTWLGSHSTWSVIDRHLVRDIRTTNYPSAVDILAAQVELAQRLDHHPVVTVGYATLRFELWTHVSGGITQLDLDYATALDELVSAQFSDVVVTT
ncbi:MAG: 4a-hydroxytetrahydrobiopterin dehydratase [Acidimicrobiales bacterium]